MAQVNSALFTPVLVLGFFAVLLSVVGAAMTARGESATADKLSDFGFGAALLAGAYVVVLLLIVLVTHNELLFDAFANILIVGVFFLLLLGLFFGVFELIASGGRRSKRVTPEGD